MRIAIFHNLSSGGAKRSLLESTRRLRRAHHVEVFTLASADHGFADLRPFVEGHKIVDFSPLPLLASPFGRVNNLARILDLVRLRRVGRSVARMIEGSRFDVALVHPCRFENSPSVIAGLGKTPSVFYCHESLRIQYETTPFRPYNRKFAGRRRALNRVDPLPGLYRSFLRRRDRANITSAAMVLVNSRFTRNQVRSAYGVEPTVSYHGVDAGMFQPSSSPRERFLLSVGSLTPLKGFDFLIEAVALIPASKRPPLVIVSNFENPPERRYLEKLSARLSVDLRLLGNITEEDLVALYQRAAMVVYGSIREPFGLVALESMACGTPVVAVREGGLPESVVEGQTGLLVEREPDTFAAAVVGLLDAPDRAREYGRNGRKHVEAAWTWEKAAQRLEEHLAAASGGRRESEEANGPNALSRHRDPEHESSGRHTPVPGLDPAVRLSETQDHRVGQRLQRRVR